MNAIKTVTSSPKVVLDLDAIFAAAEAEAKEADILSEETIYDEVETYYAGDLRDLAEAASLN
jgi:hypothetical protein